MSAPTSPGKPVMDDKPESAAQAVDETQMETDDETTAKPEELEEMEAAPVTPGNRSPSSSEEYTPFSDDDTDKTTEQPVNRTPPTANIIKAGIDNFQDIDTSQIYIPTGHKSPNIPTLKRWLKSDLRRDPRENSRPRNLGYHKRVRDVYLHVPSVRGVAAAADTQEPGGVVIDDELTRKTPLLDKKVAAYLWSVDPTLRACAHEPKEGEPQCASGCCILRRKQYIVELYRNPMPAAKQPDGSYTYTNVARDERNQEAAKKRERVQTAFKQIDSQEALTTELDKVLHTEIADDQPTEEQQEQEQEPPRKRKVIEPPPEEDPIVDVESQIGVPVEWETPAEGAPNIIITGYVDQPCNDFLGIRCHEKGYATFCKLWQDAGFTADKGFPPPTRTGLLFAGREHKKVKDDDPEFYYLSPAIGTPPSHRTQINSIVVPWWDDIFTTKMAHESWDALLPTGAQIRMRVNSRWTYRDEDWRKGQPCPVNKPGWPIRHEPSNWAVEFFTLPDPTKYQRQYCEQPVLYGAPGLTYGVTPFGAYKEALFKASSEPAAKQYYKNEQDAADSEQRELELDWTFLPRGERPDFSDYKLPGLPEDTKTQGAKIVLGVPAHATGLPGGKKSAKAEQQDRVGQMALIWVDTAEGIFDEMVSQEDIDRDFATSALTRTDHDVRSYQFRYQDGSRVINQSGDIEKRLKGEVTWVMWSYIAGMPAGKVSKKHKTRAHTYVLKCIIGLGAVRQWAYFLAPQFHSNRLPFPMPQLIGCEELDRRVLMTLAAMAALFAAELKSVFMAAQKTKVPAMTRVTGSETDPLVEFLLPTMWNHRLTQMKAKESQDVRLTTYRYDFQGKVITNISRWRVTAVSTAYKFDEEAAGCDRQTYMTRNNMFSAFDDPYDPKRYLYSTAHLTRDKIPLEAKFEWNDACDITDIEIPGFAPPHEHAAMWQVVGSLVQLKLDRPNQILHVMQTRLLAENRYFVAQGVENPIAQRLMQHILPTNYTRLFDLNHKQLQLPLREHPALFKEIGDRIREKSEAVRKHDYGFDCNVLRWVEAGPFGLDTRIGGIMSPNMADLILLFPIRYAQPTYKLLNKAAAVNPEISEDIAPKNFITQLLLGLVVGKEEDPDKFISDTEVDVALQDEAVRAIVYPTDPTEETPDIHQARIIYRIVVLRQPLAFICGPPGCGKTATVRNVLGGLKRSKQTTFAKGYPIRDDCHEDYKRPGGNLLPPELETTMVLTTANYPNDQVCERVVEKFLGPAGTFFDKAMGDLNSVSLYRHFGSLFEQVRTAKSAVKRATFIQILESIDVDKLPGNLGTNKTVYDELNDMIREDMAAITTAELAKRKPEAEERRKKLSEHVADRLKYANDLFDELLQTIHFDVIACTFSMAIDLKLRHPMINVRTIIIDEVSQTSFAEIMSAVNLLHTMFRDPVIAAFGDSNQMSAINHLTGRASKVMAVDVMALRTNPAEAIPGAFGLPPTAWRQQWKLDEPVANVESNYLRIDYRNNESLAGLIMHNYYTTADGTPQFFPAKCHEPIVRVTFRTPQAAENAGYDRFVRQLLDRNTSNFTNPYYPGLVRGINTVLWDVTDSKESDRLTSKTNTNMVQKAIALIDLFCRKMNIVWPENMAFLCAYDGLKQELEAAIRTAFGQEKDYEARENFGHKKGWRTKTSNLMNVTVGTWDGMQGKEFGLVISMCPRAMEPKKESRHVTAGTVKSSQCKYPDEFPNTPVIDHDLAEAEFGAHLVATLGFTDNLHKFLVAISRAMRFLIIMHESHTMDFSRHWNLLTRMYDINGLTTFNYIQEVENALAHSSNPSDWYGESDMLMVGVNTTDDTEQPAKVDQHKGLLQAKFNPTQTTHMALDDSFFRQLPKMIYRDFLFNGDIVRFARFRPKTPNVDQCRKDWDTVPAEPQRSFRLYKQKTLVYPAYDDAKVPDESDEFMKARMVTSVPEEIKDFRHRMHTNQMSQEDWDALEAPPQPRPESPDVIVMEEGEQELQPVSKKELAPEELREYKTALSNAQAWRGAYSHGLFTRLLTIYQNNREQFDRVAQHTLLIPPNYNELFVKATHDLQKTPRVLMQTLIDFSDTNKYKEDDIRRSWDCLQIAKLDYLLCGHKYKDLLQEFKVTDEQLRNIQVTDSPSEIVDEIRYIMPFERNYYNYKTYDQVQSRFIEMRRKDEEDERKREFQKEARDKETRRKMHLAAYTATLKHPPPVDKGPRTMPKEPLRLTVGGASSQPSTSTGGATSHGPRFGAEGFVPQPPNAPNPRHWAPLGLPNFPFVRATHAHPQFGLRPALPRHRGFQPRPYTPLTQQQQARAQRIQQREAEVEMLQLQARARQYEAAQPTWPATWGWKTDYEKIYPPGASKQTSASTQPVPQLPPMPGPTGSQPLLQPPLPPPPVEVTPPPPPAGADQGVEPMDQKDNQEAKDQDPPQT